MSEELHFGQQKNGLICTCGNHYGVEEWTPERRAAIYKRLRDKNPSILKENQFAYLTDFEHWHGPVHYTIGVVGTNVGNIRKSDDGKIVKGPIFNQEFDRARKRTA